MEYHSIVTTKVIHKVLPNWGPLLYTSYILGLCPSVLSIKIDLCIKKVKSCTRLTPQLGQHGDLNLDCVIINMKKLSRNLQLAIWQKFTLSKHISYGNYMMEISSKAHKRLISCNITSLPYSTMLNLTS